MSQQLLDFDAPIQKDIREREAELPDHDGATYDAKRDKPRLNSQLVRVFLLMQGGEWFTLREIADAIGCSEASASARLRDFRKQKWRKIFPVDLVDRVRIGNLNQYRLLLKSGSKPLDFTEPAKLASAVKRIA